MSTAAKLLLLAFLVEFSSAAAIGALDDKRPAFFESRYGPAATSIEIHKKIFFLLDGSSMSLSHEFRVLTFQSGEFKIAAAFSLPSLELAEITLFPRQRLTADQALDELRGYGEAWKRLKVASRPVLVMAAPPIIWEAKDGSLAVFLLGESTIVIQTPVIMRRLAIEAAKTNSAPK